MSVVRGKRPLKATFTPTVKAHVYSAKVLLDVGGWSGSLAWHVHQEMPLDEVATLVVALRKAMRECRAHVLQQVARAEAEL